ncbi:MAG: amidohydrolase family protein [Candidatus Zixiibacteriota bacterium]|nr:MAG: amidohydrolase family protein [candidate division Zixibacteria bacterium]
MRANPLAAILAGLVFLSLGFSVHAETVALVGGTVIDVSSFGKSQSDIKSAVVLIEGEKITAVGSKDVVKIPKDARVIDVRGKYVVPGLIDGYAALDNQSYANAYLYIGVTSIVGCHGYKRGALFEDANPSPNIYLYGDVAHHEIGTDEILARIEACANRGVKFLNLMYALKPEQLKPAIERAHELGMVAIGEFVNISYRDAIRYGIDGFIHFNRYSIELAPDEMRRKVAEQPFGHGRGEYMKYLQELSPEEEIVRDYAKILGSSPVALMPTMSVISMDHPLLENPWNERVASILDPADIHNPVNKSTGKHDYKPEAFEKIARAIDNFLKIENQYYKAGARYLAGSGNDINGTMPGISLHQELLLLTKIGLSEREALAAATSNFAEFFNWKEAGEVKPGRRADLVVTDKNPLEDIKNLKQISLVMLRGKIIDREELLKAT